MQQGQSVTSRAGEQQAQKEGISAGFFDGRLAGENLFLANGVRRSGWDLVGSLGYFSEKESF
jgi:hypothetical protein